VQLTGWRSKCSNYSGNSQVRTFHGEHSLVRCLESNVVIDPKVNAPLDPVFQAKYKLESKPRPVFRSQAESKRQRHQQQKKESTATMQSDRMYNFPCHGASGAVIGALAFRVHEEYSIIIEALSNSSEAAAVRQGFPPSRKELGLNGELPSRLGQLRRRCRRGSTKGASS
jgi:hypothetical protein